jgi:hypothetical protein
VQGGILQYHRAYTVMQKEENIKEQKFLLRNKMDKDF